MPTRPPPERRTNGPGTAGGNLLWFFIPVLFAVLVVVQMSVNQLRLEAREQRYWSDLSLIYDAGRTGMCEPPVDPEISETCAKLKAAR